MTVEIVAHDPRWRSAYLTEARAIAKALGTDMEDIHHIGSTAVPGLAAKPVIDMLCVVTSRTGLETAAARLANLGYVARGENGIAGRRYFVKVDDHGVRSRHLHVFAAGSDHIERHLAFRDYLLAHPGKAVEYARLKTAMAATMPTRRAYQAGKAPFVEALLAEAMAWRDRR